MHPVHGNPRMGLLRTICRPHDVLRSPFQGLCVQIVKIATANCRDFLSQTFPSPTKPEEGQFWGPKIAAILSLSSEHRNRNRRQIATLGALRKSLLSASPQGLGVLRVRCTGASGTVSGSGRVFPSSIGKT